MPLLLALTGIPRHFSSLATELTGESCPHPPEERLHCVSDVYLPFVFSGPCNLVWFTSRFWD